MTIVMFSVKVVIPLVTGDNLKVFWFQIDMNNIFIVLFKDLRTNLFKKNAHVKNETIGMKTNKFFDNRYFLA